MTPSFDSHPSPALFPCWYCKTKLKAADFGRQDSCPQCRRDTRVCKNCFFYDPSLSNECKEPVADRVVEKEKSCFCDYFKPSETTSGTAGAIQKDLRAAAEALFKKK